MTTGFNSANILLHHYLPPIRDQQEFNLDIIKVKNQLMDEILQFWQDVEDLESWLRVATASMS